MKIEVKNLSYSYNNNESYAIKNVSLNIDEGEFIAIVGHTGSGKSTFIQNLNGLLIPSSGEVLVDNYVIKNKAKIKDIKQLRKKIGIVFQFPEYQLFEETVEKDILFGPKNFNLINEQNSNSIVREVLKTVNLDESFLAKSPFELSGGEKRRVAIAGILAFNPDVLIVDEPTAGLDPVSSNNMMELFKSLNDNGKTIILVTHQMDHVIKYASRVIVFNKGEVVFDNTPLNLFKDASNVNKLGIGLPNVINLVEKISKKYPKIKNYTIKTIDDFVKAYKDVISL
ncbi:MAG: energy-coupling factor transporter ATPase [Erysipelotrichaceae bacterium]|nr:energy-coupling factor transporter ATPase [Erysipelotrichaceae bacterium]